MITTMKMGLELYSVREAFNESPEKALKKVAHFGYDCVELFGDHFKKFEPERVSDALADAGISCCGYLTSWEDMQMNNYEVMLRYNEKLKNNKLAIGSAPIHMLANRFDLADVIDHLNKLNEIAGREGFRFGYHNHETDFVMVDGIPAWRHIFDNTPEDFLMVLDTGNALSGGAQSIPLLQRYSRRSPWVHIKPYSKRTGYSTMIGEDDIAWPETLKACIELGGAEILTVEYGERERYEPFYGAKLCYDRLREMLTR